VPKVIQKRDVLQGFMRGVAASIRAFAIRAQFDKNISLEAWGREFTPAYLPLPCGQHHRAMDGLLRGLGKKPNAEGKVRGRKIKVKAPRGNSKSTFCTFLYPLHEIVSFSAKAGLEGGGEAYILLIADTYKQAKKYLNAIKQELEHNVKLAQVYPEACGLGPVWSEDEILTRNGVRVEILGSGQKIRGRKEKNLRPTLIIIDDPEGDECAYSAIIREHTKDWFEKGVLNAGGPYTNFLLVGTNVHEECLVSTQVTGWEEYLFQSIVQWPKRMDLWDEWETILRDTSVHKDDLRKPEDRALAFFRENEAEMQEGAVVLWPEHEPLYALMLLRAGGHNAFEAEKQNEPVDPSKTEWPLKTFFPSHVWVDSMPPVKECQVKVTYGDPSKGQGDKNGDFQAIVDAAVGADGFIYIDSDIGYRTLPDFCAEFVTRANRNKSWVARCESNTFQELLLPDMEAAATELGILCPVQGQENMTNKDLRIRRYVGPYLTRGRIKFVRRSRGNAELVKQLSRFPTSGKRDGPDALAGAIQACEELLGVVGDDAPEDPN